MTPQEINTWMAEEAEKYASSESPWNEDRPDPEGISQRAWENSRNDFLAGADATYNLLSKEISEKDGRILKLENHLYDQFWRRHIEAGIKEADVVKAFEKFKIETNL